MQDIIVLKFGGSSLGDNKTFANNFIKITEIIEKYQKSYKKIVIVVSALAGETRRLKSMAEMTFAHNDLKHKDSILAFGEIFSSKLFEQYLISVNKQAIALVEDKLPIMVNEIYGNADIINVDTDEINKQLNLNQIVIIPGYIGRTKNNNLATLGFDGSDTTAITVSTYLKADVCCLFKDVKGIYSANPRRVKLAKKIDAISYDNMFALSILGARIVHPKAVEQAMQNNLTIKVLPMFCNDEGTSICTLGQTEGAIGITYYEHQEIIQVSIVGNNLNHVAEDITMFLANNGIQSRVIDAFYKLHNITIALINKQDLDYCLSILHNLFNLDAETEDTNKLVDNTVQAYYDPVIKS